MISIAEAEAIDLYSVWNGSGPGHYPGSHGTRVDGQSTCSRPQLLHRRSRSWSQQSAEQSGGSPRSAPVSPDDFPRLRYSR
jgi:hypothetical protein